MFVSGRCTRRRLRSRCIQKPWLCAVFSTLFSYSRIPYDDILFLRQFNSCVVVGWCTYECAQARPDITTHHMGWRWSCWRLEVMVALQCAWSHNATALYLYISIYPKNGNLKLSVVILFWEVVMGVQGVDGFCGGSLLKSEAV